MKNIFKLLSLLLFMCCIASCDSDSNNDNLNPGETTDNPLTISASGDNIVLNEDKSEEVALTFTWNTGNNRGEGTSLSYLFKVDIAENQFQTAIETEEMPEGVFSRSFTHRELNELLLDYWEVQPAKSARIEARVIATVTGPHFIKPEISDVVVTVTPFAPRVIETNKMYAVGTAVPGGQIEMSRAIEDPYVFAYKGLLQEGKIKFPLSLDASADIVSSRTPNLTIDDGTMMPVLLATSGTPDNSWLIPNAGTYVVVINTKEKTVVFYSEATAIKPKYDNVYMIAEAVPGGGKDWDVDNPLSMTQSIANPNIFVFNETLDAGEAGKPSGRIRFPIEKGVGWGYKGLTTPDGLMVPVTKGKTYTVYQFVAGSPEYPDNYWQILDGDINLIILDTEKMTIRFMSR
ncbi:MAG: SusE domain-containing protein [Dysgonamonadaceae bacterium]|nr:SusE domain-containing protein [Dysgonamonadaceae bacterium]